MVPVSSLALGFFFALQYRKLVALTAPNMTAPSTFLRVTRWFTVQFPFATHSGRAVRKLELNQYNQQSDSQMTRTTRYHVCPDRIS